MKTFVIKYHRLTGDVVYEEFDDLLPALRRRHEWEESCNNDKDIEIVSISTESLESLKISHRRYFLKEIFAA